MVGFVFNAFKLLREKIKLLDRVPSLAAVTRGPVYSGSDKTVKPSLSLNDWLSKGPLLLDLITAVLHKSRLAPYLLSPDIAKASQQISLREEDPQVCLFPWVRDSNEPASGENLVIYWINRVIYGHRSSPPLRGVTIEHHMEAGNTALSREVLANCYMDNFYITTEDIEEASGKYRAFKLDPLGFVSPAIPPARLAFQATCKAKYGWDDPIDTKLLEQLNKAIECWASTERRVNRLIRPKGHQVSESCDASGYSYGAAAYLVTAASDGTRSSNLIFSRSSLKALNTNPTILRLELMAATLGARLVDFVQKQLTAKASGTTLWTDCQVVFFWIRSKEKQPVFVENRLREIRSVKALYNICIKHVSTEENSAYILSRGISAPELQDHPFWWHEPSYLGQSCIDIWPVQPTLTEYEDMQFDYGELEIFPNVRAQPPNKDSDGSHLEPLCASITDASLHNAYEIDGRVVWASSGPIPLLASDLHVDKVPAYARMHRLTPTPYTTLCCDQAIGLSYRFAGYITVFCRPGAYLSEGPLRRASDPISYPLDSCLGACVVAHTGNSEIWHQRDDLRHQLANILFRASFGQYHIVGLGKCGLDYTKKAPVCSDDGTLKTRDRGSLWHPTIEKRKHQMPVFEGQLTLAKQLGRPDRRRYPLAYHLRNHASMNTEIQRDELEAMAKVKQPEDYRIHSHFWSGDLGQYQRWIDQYSQTLLGINSDHLKHRLTQAQIEFLRTIPQSKAVFESDEQHHGSVGTSQSIGTPAGVIWAITKLKELVNLPQDVRTVAQNAMGNDLRLYRPCLLFELIAVCDAGRVGPHFQYTSIYLVSDGRREDTFLSLDWNYVHTGLADDGKALSAIQLDLCCWAGRFLCDRPQEMIQFLHELFGHSALETAAVLDRWYQQITASSLCKFRRVTKSDVILALRKRVYGCRAAHSWIKKVQPTSRYACQMKTTGLQQEVQDALVTVGHVLPDALAAIYQQITTRYHDHSSSSWQDTAADLQLVEVERCHEDDQLDSSLESQIVSQASNIRVMVPTSKASRLHKVQNGQITKQASFVGQSKKGRRRGSKNQAAVDFTHELILKMIQLFLEHAGSSGSGPNQASQRRFSQLRTRRGDQQ